MGASPVLFVLLCKTYFPERRPVPYLPGQPQPDVLVVVLEKLPEVQPEAPARRSRNRWSGRQQAKLSLANISMIIRTRTIRSRKGNFIMDSCGKRRCHAGSLPLPVTWSTWPNHNVSRPLSRSQRWREDRVGEPLLGYGLAAFTRPLTLSTLPYFCDNQVECKGFAPLYYHPFLALYRGTERDSGQRTWLPHSDGSFRALSYIQSRLC